MANLKHMNNEMAVSPIVATLVLIVVAVIGAVAVGTIMGTFSTDVSKQASSSGAKSAAANEILIAGSTTLYPAELNLKADYERQNPGVQINVQQGGSGVGVNSVGMGISDIGASSFASTITTAQTNNPNNPAFQNLYYTMIGGRGVVFITNAASPANKSPLSASNPMTVADLQAIYNDAYLSKGVFTNSSYNGVFQSGYTVVEARESGSGTQQSASNFIFGSTGTIEGLKNTIVNQGNEGELAAIQSTPYAFGLVDAGYAFPNSGTTPATGIIPLPITWNNGTALNTYTPSHTNIKHALTDWNRGNAQDTTSYPNNYPQGLVSGLYWVTQGTVPTASSATGVITSPGTSAASSVITGLIQFAKTENEASAYTKAGMYSLYDFT